MNKIKLIITFILLGLICYLVYNNNYYKKEKLSSDELSELAKQKVANEKYINEQIDIYIKEKKFDPIHITFILDSYHKSINNPKQREIFIDSVKSYFDNNLAERVYYYLRMAINIEQEEKTVIYTGLLAKYIITEGKIGNLDLDRDMRENMFRYIFDYIDKNKIVLTF